MTTVQNRKTICGRLPPKIIAELKNVRFGACGPDRSYSKSIIQHQIGDDIISNNVSLTFRTIIDPATGWFEIVEIPM